MTQEIEGATLTEESGVQARESARIAAEAAEAALARSHVPPGMTVEPAVPNQGAGHRIAAAAAAARNLPGGDDVFRSDDPGRDAMDRLATDSPIEDDVERATDWLLSDVQEVNTRIMRVRLGGTDERPVMADWVLQAIGLDAIRKAEREAAGNRSARRGGGTGEPDEMKANLRVVQMGTIEIRDVGAKSGTPLIELAKAKGHADPVTWMQRRFHFRPGLIASLAGEVMSLSGFDQDDVKAAGN